MNSNIASTPSDPIQTDDSPGWGGQILALVVALAVCYAAAALGAIATDPNTDPWFQQLRQPAWAPPNWLFGPVWSTLYTLMGVGAFLIWRRLRAIPLARTALVLFGIQLVLNIAWSWIFFAAHAPGVAFAEIVVLWVAIAAWLVATWRVTRVGALLNLPYLAWVSFAAVLNFTIWQMN